MSYYKIRPRSGTASQWSTANPTLKEREIGFEVPNGGSGTGVVKMKMGDGITAWNDLPYAILVPELVQNATTNDATKVPSASVAKNLQDQITELNTDLHWHIINKDNINYAVGTSYYKYNGLGEKFVKVEAIINQTLPANGEYPINSIPLNLIPSSGIQFNISTTLGNPCAIILKTDGTLCLKPRVNLEANESIYSDFLDYVV